MSTKRKTETSTISVNAITPDEIRVTFETEKPKFQFEKPKDEIDRALQAFLLGATEGKFGKYCIHGDRFLYKSIVSDETGYLDAADESQYVQLQSMQRQAERGEIDLYGRHDKGDLLKVLEARTGRVCLKYRVNRANLIAYRMESGDYIGNSSVLGLIGRSVSFGNERLNRNETEVQRRLSLLIPMIPFSVFHETGLDIGQLSIIDSGKPETLPRSFTRYDSAKRENVTEIVDMHYTGARLFACDDRLFLFDVDRREVEHKIFNPFVVELTDTSVATIAAAYESLVPELVREAQRRGLSVKRQGEWFFVPTFKSDEIPHGAEVFDSSRSSWARIELRAGRNRPNECKNGFKYQDRWYVNGKVSHSGREHADLVLSTDHWWLAVPNTSINSWTITGNID